VLAPRAGAAVCVRWLFLVCCAVLRCWLCLRCWVRLRCRLCLSSFSLTVSLDLFPFCPCSYSPLLLSQLFAFCVLWCLAFLLRTAVLCVLSCFLITDCGFSFGLVDVISRYQVSLSGSLRAGQELSKVLSLFESKCCAQSEISMHGHLRSL
jgi:hypothetical protein